MSDDTPRRIAGLQPREKPPLSRLLKSERPDAPVEPAEPSQAATPPSTPRRQQKRSSRTPTQASTRKPSATFYIPEALQTRARAAFVQTRNSEGDESYSHMASKALEAEVARREMLYNNGKPFTGGAAPLPPGRPLQG